MPRVIAGCTLGEADLRAAVEAARRGEAAIGTACRADSLALGVFDALHLGHRELVRRLVEAARGSGPGGVAALGTFDPHPRAVLHGAAPARLLQESVRDRLLAAWGVDLTVTLRVDRALLAMEAREFIEGLHAAVGFRHLIVGANFRFGRDRSGTVATLRDHLGEAAVIVVPPVLLDDELVSATRVRGCLAEGDVDAVTELLGRPYAVVAVPERGDGLGRTIGSPTVNLDPVPPALPDGVYAVATSLGPGVVHMGPRPTLGRVERRFELHLLDAPPPEEVGEVEVRFVARLREVMRFPDLESLRARIRADIAAARAALDAHRA